MFALMVTQVGNTTGVILPKEAVSRLKVEKGDKIYVTEAPDGGYRLTPYSPGFAEQMDLARKIMKARRNTLRELAK